MEYGKLEEANPNFIYTLYIFRLIASNEMIRNWKYIPGQNNGNSLKGHLKEWQILKWEERF